MYSSTRVYDFSYSDSFLIQWLNKPTNNDCTTRCCPDRSHLVTCDYNLTPQGQFLRGHSLFERMLKYFEQRPMRERRECEMQNFISFLVVLIFLENFVNFLREILLFIKNVPPRDNCPWQVTLRALSMGG